MTVFDPGLADRIDGLRMTGPHQRIRRAIAALGLERRRRLTQAPPHKADYRTGEKEAGASSLFS